MRSTLSCLLLFTITILISWLGPCPVTPAMLRAQDPDEEHQPRAHEKRPVAPAEAWRPDLPAKPIPPEVSAGFPMRSVSWLLLLAGIVGWIALGVGTWMLLNRRTPPKPS